MQEKYILLLENNEKPLNLNIEKNQQNFVIFYLKINIIFDKTNCFQHFCHFVKKFL